VWRRELLEHDGPAYQIPLPPGAGTGLGKPLKLINHPVRPRIPIFLASLGPKNVQLAAELADGWFPTFFHPDKAAQVWGRDLAIGASRRSPELAPLDIAAGGTVCLTSDTALAQRIRDMARPRLALYIGGMGAKGRNFYNDLFRRYGYEAEAAQIQELYLSGSKREAEALIPDDYLEATSLVGDEGRVKERVQAFREAGKGEGDGDGVESARVPTEAPRFTIGDLPAKGARLWPGQAALLWDGGTRSRSYAGLDDRVRRLVTLLQEAGVTAGARVGMLARNRPEYFELFFACARLGATMVPVNIRLSPQEIGYQVRDSGMSHAILDPDVRDLAEAAGLLGLPHWVLGEAYESALRAAVRAPDTPSRDDSLDVAQMYTSGTTGFAKGCTQTAAAGSSPR
jgi:hypothetical protein